MDFHADLCTIIKLSILSTILLIGLEIMNLYTKGTIMGRISFLLTMFILFTNNIFCNKADSTELISLTNSSIDTTDITEDLFHLGQANLESKNFILAKQYFTEYIDYYDTTDDKKKHILIILRVSRLFKTKLFYGIALDYLLMALDIAIEYKEDELSGKIHNRIGEIYYDLHRFDDALTYYTKAEKIYSQLGNEVKIAISLNNIAEIHRFNKNYPLALEYYLKSIELNKKHSKKLMLAYNYNNIALVYLEQQKINEAYKFILKAKELIYISEDKEKRSSIFSSLGYYFYCIKDYDKAIENYKKTIDIDISGAEREIIVIRDAYEGLRKSYSNINDYKKAYASYLKYTELREKVFDKKTQQQIFEIEYKSQIEKKEQEITFLQKIVKLENKKKIIANTLLGMLFVLLIFVIYSFILKSKTLRQKTTLFKQQDKLNKLDLQNKEVLNQALLLENKQLEAAREIDKLKQKNLEEKLEHKKRELSLSTFHIINKNNILVAIKETLNELKQRGGIQITPVISQIKREIDSCINLDEDWKIFKLHFESVHKNFYKRLISSYPDLTFDELKLCAYLKINLSSKEIAQILNITISAVNKRRNRLRKKFNIDPDTDLVIFIIEEKF